MARGDQGVAVTRARRGETARLLEAAGLRVFHLPAIAIAPPGDPAPLREAVADLLAFDDLLFTSVSGVRAHVEVARSLGVPPFGGLRLLVVGEATAAAVREAGGEVSVVGEAGAAALADHPDVAPLSGRRILFPRAEEGRDAFVDAARCAGAKVELVSAYRTLERPEAGVTLRPRIASGEIRAVCFASPSAVRAIVQGLGEGGIEGCSDLICAAIGETTAGALREACAGQIVVASEPDAAALARVVIEHL